MTQSPPHDTRAAGAPAAAGTPAPAAPAATPATGTPPAAGTPPAPGTLAAAALPADPLAPPPATARDPQVLIERIRDSVIGDGDAVQGPFGLRRVTYADYTASGRSLTFIEDYIREAVLPLYANTHTESSGTGLQTTRFREGARRIIRRAVGASADHAVIFAGSGSTGAMDKLVGILNLRIPADLDARYRLREHIPPAERPVVFIGPYEHHTNELPWRESIADVVKIHEDADGHIDLAHLEEELRRHADRPLRIGSFSAASNVTGILSDTRAISVLLHRHGALSFWDFAAAAPYLDIEMDPHRPAPAAGATTRSARGLAATTVAADATPPGNTAPHAAPVASGTGAPDAFGATGPDTSEAHLDYKDAIVLSPHKFIGGPGTPGLLVARRELLRNTIPAVVGGGTVAFVNAEEHVYLSDPEHREEGGTPAIVESIRAGLVFQLKSAVTVDAIREREESFTTRAIERWSAVPGLEILGNRTARRLSIVSFVVRHGTRHMHHNVIVAMLNDVFGIQSRGGCSCAGPYGHRLLGIDIERSHAFEREVDRGCDGIKPGWVRVNFNYFISETVFQYILDAVELLATQGWRLLPQYQLDPGTGLWRHAAGLAEPPHSLEDIDYADGRMTYRLHRHHAPESALAGYLAEARDLCASPPEPPAPPQAAVDLAVGPDFQALRWFLMPDEAATELGVG